jgi:hypothetical protein
VPLRGALTLGFVNETGSAEIIAPDVMVEILRPHAHSLRLVFLNGCTTVELSKQVRRRHNRTPPHVTYARLLISCAPPHIMRVP